MLTQIAAFVTGSKSAGPAVVADNNDTPVSEVQSLAMLGLRPRVLWRDGPVSASGAGFCWSVRMLSAAPEMLAAELERVRALLLRGIAVNLTLADAGARSSRRIEQLLRKLKCAVSAPCIDQRLIGLAVLAEEMPLPAFLLMSKILLGQGPRYVVLGKEHLGRGGQSEASPAWTALYQQRSWRWGLRPVYGGDSRTRCALLSDEQSPALLSAHGMRVPAASAWLCLELHICRYSNRHGHLDTAKLHESLVRGLDIADRLFDKLCWHDATQSKDALSNRRIAFILQGIGDLVVLRRDDPSDIACLRRLDRLVAGIHECLWNRSHRLAAERGLLPALAARNPSHCAATEEYRRSWQERWNAALSGAAVRHRNLLALSPYALLPQSGASCRNFMDLLPLLAHADVCGFAPAADFSDWNISEFKNFHCRAYAIMQRRNAATFVAAGA